MNGRPDSEHGLPALLLSCVAVGSVRVGAVVPSGTALADAITAEISVSTGPVIELGAGTGVFSRALLARSVPEEQLTLVESDADLARLLQVRFPSARTLRMDAARLKSIESFEDAGAIVNGLPLLSMSPRRVIAILDGAFRHLRPGGALYQFTYEPRCPIPHALLHRLGLRASRIGAVLANLPPAAVYRIRRRRALGGTQGRNPYSGNHGRFNEMNSLRVWIIFSWVALPTVMYGGYSLLRLSKNGASTWKERFVPND